ncbi:MAG: hypothetical protein U0804_00170 [Gemmataceae bacterium]
MYWFAVALDTAASLLAVSGTALYVLVPWVKRHSRQWLRAALRNRRAYLLAFECSGVFLSVWGVLGQLVRQYPHAVELLANNGVDVPGVLEATGVHLDLRTLGGLRLGLLAVAVGCMAAGLLCRVYGRREVFAGVREAVEYGVTRGLSAVSYVVVCGGERVATTATRPSLDEARWRACVDEFPVAMAKLSADVRPARQGENVRVAYETAEGLVYYYRFGAHAYLVASAAGGRGRRRAEAEARHLIRSIQALASVHGA